jgi:hypothetical protein
MDIGRGLTQINVEDSFQVYNRGIIIHIKCLTWKTRESAKEVQKINDTRYQM